MSTPEIIYNNILNSVNFTGTIPSPDVREYHKSIINVFLNYQSGSSTVNLWDKLDFLFFFDTDNESIRFINWVNPNSITASVQNDNFAPSYNYSYLGPAQEQIAKWWDGKNTPIGGKDSTINDGTLTYAWLASTGQPIETSQASGSIGGGIKQYVIKGQTLINGNTGSLPDIYVETLTQTFIHFPFTSSYSYQYEVQNGYILPDKTGYSFYSSNYVTFSNIVGDTRTYNGIQNFRSGSSNNTYSSISVKVLQNPLRHEITITAPQKPPLKNPPVNSIVNSQDTFNSKNRYPFSYSYLDLFNPRVFYDPIQSDRTNYYANLLQNWILNNNYLVGKVGNFQRYPNYYQALNLNNGSYFNTNVNIKQIVGRKYQLNDGFIGFLKMGLGGGVRYSTTSYPSQTDVTSTGPVYVGVAESETSNSSLGIKLNKQYFHDTPERNTGFQAGLGTSITSSYKEIDYVWKAYTGSNPFPYQTEARGNIDFDSSFISASNASSRAGRPGLYIAQRYTSSITTATIKQYFNNLEAASTDLGIGTGSIPDGNFYLNGLGSSTYVDENYVNASTNQFVTKSLANISSVSSGSFFGTTTYTSSALISDITAVSNNVLTYFTGAYDPQTGFGVNGARFTGLPSTTTLDSDFTITFRLTGYTANLPKIDDQVHIGYEDNQIGYVKSVQTQNYSDDGNNNVDHIIIATATKTTGSGINSGNSTIVRFYENNYINIGSTFNSTTRGILYSTTISGSGLYTTSSAINTSFLLSPLDTQVINYPFNGVNGFPNQSISIVSGSELEFIISSSVPVFADAGPAINWKLAFPFGNQVYSGSEFGTTYFTRFTGSYITSSNDLETIFITSNTGNVIYDNNTFLSNGSYTLAEPSVSGSIFNFQYSGSAQNSLLTGLNTTNLFKITTLNPEYNTFYFAPNGKDLKQSNRQVDRFIIAFAGGGINNTNLKFLYKQLYDLIFTRSTFKQSGLPVINFEPFVLNTDNQQYPQGDKPGTLYYTSDIYLSNAYPVTVDYPNYVQTKDDRLTWNAATDLQSDFVGTSNTLGSTLYNSFNI
jgi:hypothetical protein